MPLRHKTNAAILLKSNNYVKDRVTIWLWQERVTGSEQLEGISLASRNVVTYYVTHVTTPERRVLWHYQPIRGQHPSPTDQWEAGPWWRQDNCHTPPPAPSGSLWHWGDIRGNFQKCYRCHGSLTNSWPTLDHLICNWYFETCVKNNLRNRQICPDSKSLARLSVYLCSNLTSKPKRQNTLGQNAQNSAV